MGGEKTYSAALIGCGRIGYSLGLDKKREQPASHTMALLANPRINLIAACDTNSQNLQFWHEAHKKITVYSDSANLYTRQKPKIITIAVNENAHLKETLAAINQNPSLVILEKPVALNMGEAKSIEFAANVNNVNILVNHERRFSEDYILAKKYMSQIGELQSINAALYSSLAVYNPNEENSGAYSLIHDGTHLVDSVLFFLEDENFSSLKEISVFDKEKFSSQKKGGLLKSAQSLKSLPKKTKYVNSILNNPQISGLFRDQNNVVRQVSAFYSTQKCPQVCITMSGRSKYFGFEITITGTQGRICIGNGYLKFYKRAESSLYTGFYSLCADKFVKIPKKTQYFSNMIQNAVDFLDGKEKLKSTLQTGINALAVLEEIKELIKN